MPFAAREDDSWTRLDWVEQHNSFDVEVPPQPRTLRQHLRLVEADAGELEKSSRIGSEATLNDDYIVIYEHRDSSHDSTAWLSSFHQLQSEMKTWDVYDFVTICAILIVFLGFIATFINSLSSWSVLVPVGFGCMTLAVYGARRRDAHAR